MILERRLRTLETTRASEKWMRDTWWPARLKELEDKFVGKSWLLLGVLAALVIVAQILTNLVIRWVS